MTIPEDNSSKELFAVIYEFEALPGREEQFIKGWRWLTELIYEYENSRGSRLHHLGGQTYVAYATWPDELTWKNSGSNMPPEADEARKLMRESMAGSKTVYAMNMIEDLLKKEAHH